MATIMIETYWGNYVSQIMNEYSSIILQGPINTWIISFKVGQLYAVFWWHEL